MPKRYPEDQRDRAVRMVLDRLGEYDSGYAACSAIGPMLNIGVNGQQLVPTGGQQKCPLGAFQGHQRALLLAAHGRNYWPLTYHHGAVLRPWRPIRRLWQFGRAWIRLALSD